MVIVYLNKMLRLHLISRKGILLATTLFLYSTEPCKAYSVFAHEAIVDANWDNVLLPLLKQKYPGCTAEEFKQAHAFAYGGAVVPDMGYYPFGSKLFTNLIHYVRSGDFVKALLTDAQNIQEYAFALGVLCHYYADKYGHSEGINPGVPLIYPKMKRKFGDTVTYAENKISHVRTEFSFDVLQTVKGNYASIAYHDFVGFRVASQVLEKAFRETYGLDAKELFGNLPRAIGIFRWTVMNFFPVITRTAWITQRMEIKKQTPSVTGQKFIYRIQQKNYRESFDSSEEKPRFIAHVLSLIIRIAPKVGPLRALKFKEPGPDAENMFFKSFNTAADQYSGTLQKIKNKNIELVNIDFDTGMKTMQGEYVLADRSYNDLLLKLQAKNFETLTPSLQQNIILFYNETNTSASAERKSKEWQRTMSALRQLKMTSPKG